MGKDGLDKLVCSQHMGLQLVELCSANRAEAMRLSPVKALKIFFFGLKFAIA